MERHPREECPCPGNFQVEAKAGSFMKPIYEYLDYREYLKEYYEEKKRESPSYVYKTLAAELGLDTGNAFRILQGKAHLPARCISRALEILDLSGQSAEFFLLLITCSRERNPKSREEIVEKAKTLRVDVQAKLASRTAVQPGGAFGKVSVMVESQIKPIRLEDDIAKAFELLLQQGLVKRSKSGKLVLSRPRMAVLAI
jgi:hypothetical protein